MQSSPIKRESLRDQVRESLLRQIVEGALAPGESLTESELSESLGVSRTPLREALIQLEQEGLVRSARSRGFRVAPLTVEEIDGVFPIAGALHALALKTAGAPAGGTLEILETLNTVMEFEADGEKVFNQDLKWHRLLVAHCPNARLLGLIDSISDSTRRYNLAYFRGAGDTRVSTAEHAEVLKLLREGDVEGAAGRLDAHWRSGVGVMKAWLATRGG